MGHYLANQGTLNLTFIEVLYHNKSVCKATENRLGIHISLSNLETKITRKTVNYKKLAFKEFLARNGKNS